MKYLKVIVFIFLISSLTSCEKEIYKITVKGKITDATTGEPLSNVSVKLTYNTEAILGFDAHVIGSAETDNNGNYEIRFRPLKESRRYNFEVGKEKYICTESAYIEYSGGEEKEFDGSFALYPEAEVEVHLQNVSPYDENDNLNCHLSFTKSGKSGRLLGIFMGKDVNKTVSQIIPGNQNVVIDWSVKKNDIIKYYSDSIFCKPFQTTKFDLKY